MRKQLSVRLSSRAAAAFDGLHPQRRGMLIHALIPHEFAPSRPGLQSVYTRNDVVACEVIERAEERVMLVYAVLDLREAEASLRAETPAGNY